MPAHQDSPNSIAPLTCLYGTASSGSRMDGTVLRTAIPFSKMIDVFEMMRNAVLILMSYISEQVRASVW
jgi:hypothetical protein